MVNKYGNKMCFQDRHNYNTKGSPGKGKGYLYMRADMWIYMCTMDPHQEKEAIEAIRQ